VTGGTFTRHGAPRSFGDARELVKNADDNWPTACRAFPEVTAAHPARNRDDYRVSPTECTLVLLAGID
jgi:hypothetical protein